MKTAAGAGDFSRRVVDISQNKEKPIGIKVNLIKGGVPGTDAPKMQALPKLG